MMRKISRVLKIKPLYLLLITTIVCIISFLAGLDVKQIQTLAIIALMMSGIIFYWEFKVSFSSLGMVLLLLVGGLDIEGFIKFSHLDVIIFLIGMMIIVEYLERVAFFEGIVNFLLRTLCKTAFSLISVFFIMTAIFASLVGVITAILFMIPIILDIALKYRVNVIPLILMVVFAANIGSSATAVGNPVGILIALGGHLTFFDFIRWSTPITIVSLLISLVFSFLIFKEDLHKLNRAMSEESKVALVEKGEISIKEQLKSWALFIGVLTVIALHEVLEKMLNLQEGNILLAAAIGGATIVLFLRHEELEDILENGVDWPVLLFFIFLFSSVGALEHVGITEIIANTLKNIAGGNIAIVLLAVMVIASLLSAFLDNVLTVAFFIPVINHLKEMGLNVYPLWWGLLFSGTYFGNFTIIASTANIVAVSLLESRKAGRITFMEWLKYGPIFSVIPIVIAFFLLYLQLPLM